jgi:nucleoside-diphosphate-sugar epimerase
MAPNDIGDGQGHRGFDAVVHFAASVPHGPYPVDSETYRVNVMSTFNILEAAAKMGVSKVIFGSSEVTYGICLVDGVVDPKWLPFEEDYPIEALLHKSADGWSFPFPGQTYPATCVMGVPSAVKPFRTATRTWNSAT